MRFQYLSLPFIVTMEMNCSPQQQRVMAYLIKKHLSGNSFRSSSMTRLKISLKIKLTIILIFQQNIYSMASSRLMITIQQLSNLNEKYFFE